MITRGTTPTIGFTFGTTDVNDITVAYLTVKQGGTVIAEKDLSEATVGNDAIVWELAQTDTLKIVDDVIVEIQCRYKTRFGKAYASLAYQETPYKILRDGEI